MARKVARWPVSVVNERDEAPTREGVGLPTPAARTGR
jgi:hypothetical protein